MADDRQREQQDEEQPSDRWRELYDLEDWAATPMAVLSIVWLGIAVLDLTGNSNHLLDAFAGIIWVIFILEFAVRLLLAPEKVEFLKHNVIMIVALVVPALRMFRIFAILRAASLARGASLVRVVGVVNRSMNALRRTLKRRAFGYVLGLTLAVLVAGAAGMYRLEPASEVRGGFTSYWDALWWTAMLLTSIGSRYWPQTAEGRVLGFLLAVYGLGILGYMTATIASFFIGEDAANPEGDVAGADDIEKLRKEIEKLRQAVLGRSNPLPSSEGQPGKAGQGGPEHGGGNERPAISLGGAAEHKRTDAKQTELVSRDRDQPGRPAR